MGDDKKKVVMRVEWIGGGIMLFVDVVGRGGI